MVLRKSGSLLLLVVCMLCCVMGLSGQRALAAEEEITIFLDGNRLSSDVAPVLQNGRTLLPFRVCAEALGADVEWVAASKTVNMIKEDTSITLRIGSDQAVVNGVPYQLDVSAQIKNGRTLVPLRFVGEALSCQVDWIPATNSVEITTAQVGGEDYANPLTAEDLERYRLEILDSINAYRDYKGIGALRLSEAYSDLAQQLSEDMAAYRYLGSTSQRLGSLAARAANAGLYQPSENVAKLDLTEDGSTVAAVEAWKTDYLTNAVLLQPTAAYLGVGVAADANNPNVLYLTVEVPATKAYFTEKPTEADSHGSVTFTGYASGESVSIQLYRLTSEMHYEEVETYKTTVSDGQFAISARYLTAGEYMAKVSNDTFSFTCEER